MEAHQSESLLELADRIPPFIAYAVANRRFNKKMPLRRYRVLAKEAGLSPRTFMRIAAKETWRGHLDVCDAFCRACRVNILDFHQVKAYVRTTLLSENPFPHLTELQKARLVEKIAAFKGWQA